MAGLLNSKQRIVLVKVLAFLTLIRWYNLLLFSAGFVVLSRQLHGSWRGFISDSRFWLINLALLCIIAGGYIINAFYDFEKDLANQRKDLIINRVISRRFTLNSYVILSFLGVFGVMGGGFSMFASACLFAFSLWFYSHKLKKKAFVSDVSASLLAVTPFLLFCLYYQTLPLWLALYGFFIFTLILTRELVKDIEAIKGDMLFGYMTFPVKYGLRRSKALLWLLMGISSGAALLQFSLAPQRPGVYWYFFPLLLVALAFVMLPGSHRRNGFKRINTLYKVNLVYCLLVPLFWV